jgi:cytochrome c556
MNNEGRWNVIALKQSLFNARRTAAVALGSVCLAAAVLGSGLVASAQNQSAATPEDAILARKTLMDTLSDNMDQIEAMISTNKIDVPDAHDHADAISAMLMAFPHLFPPSTNQWKPDVTPDPVTGTSASPEVWTKFADFYKRANDASKTAFDISRAEKADDVKAGTAKLRTACNECHAAYMKQ